MPARAFPGAAVAARDVLGGGAAGEVRRRRECGAAKALARACRGGTRIVRGSAEGALVSMASVMGSQEGPGRCVAAGGGAWLAVPRSGMRTRLCARAWGHPGCRIRLVGLRGRSAASWTACVCGAESAHCCEPFGCSAVAWCRVCCAPRRDVGCGVGCVGCWCVGALALQVCQYSRAAGPEGVEQGGGAMCVLRGERLRQWEREREMERERRESRRAFCVCCAARRARSPALSAAAALFIIIRHLRGRFSGGGMGAGTTVGRGGGARRFG